VFHGRDEPRVRRLLHGKSNVRAAARHSVKEGDVVSLVNTATEIRTFSIDTPEEELTELRRRIAATRWPSKELVPDAGTMAALQNPDSPTAGSQQKEIEAAARALGMELRFWRASSGSELVAAFEAMKQSRVRAVHVGADAFLASARDQLVQLSARHALPAIYSLRDVPVAVASRDLDPGSFDPGKPLLDEVNGLTLLALVGIVDPPRKEAKKR